MADENNPNGTNGGGSGANGKNGKVGLVERVTSGVKQDIHALKTDIPAKAKEQIEGLKDPTKTQVCICIRRRLIATQCATAIPGAWAGSRFICSSFSPTPACC